MGPHGEPSAWVGTWTDIDARRQAEESLQRQTRILKSMLDSMGDGVVVVDEGGRFLLVNPAAKRMLALGDMKTLNPHIEGRRLYLLDGVTPCPEADLPLVRAMGGDPADGVEMIARSESPSDDIRISVTARPLVDDAGTLRGGVAVFRDITEQHRAGDNLRHLEDQLRQSHKMEAIGQLAGGVAHDFNNLLTIITGYSELLLQTCELDDPKQSLIEAIRAAGERSASLTNQLLTFSRKQALAPKVVDLNDVVRKTEKMLRRIIGEDVELLTELQDPLDPVLIDPGQTGQVILNLAVNARDAMPSGGTLLIRTRNFHVDANHAARFPGLKPGPHVILSITDTGGGMTEGVRQRLFEPFFTTKDSDKGTGLGLSVVHGIIKQSGGDVAVDSRPGEGATFHIYLPRALTTVQPERPPRILVPPERGTETILLVEDDDAVRALARHALQGAGYTILEAARADEALRITTTHDHPIHILVTDVVMPGMGGSELADRFLALRPGAAVLYLSGYTEDALNRQGIMQDQVHFLQKPFPPSALARKVREVLEVPVT
jgi:signal transduction histidine kinase